MLEQQADGTWAEAEAAPAEAATASGAARGAVEYDPREIADAERELARLNLDIAKSHARAAKSLADAQRIGAKAAENYRRAALEADLASAIVRCGCGRPAIASAELLGQPFTICKFCAARGAIGAVLWVMR